MILAGQIFRNRSLNINVNLCTWLGVDCRFGLFLGESSKLCSCSLPSRFTVASISRLCFNIPIAEWQYKAEILGFNN